MNTLYNKSYSKFLGREMEYKTYGDAGRAVLVFPSQDGRFYDYEDFSMVESLATFIDSGKIRLICADGIDGETWSNMGGEPRKRIELHEQWYNYIIEELIPAVRHGNETFIVTGCSMGGFHAGLFFFRRPDLFDTLLSLSGLFNADYFFGNYSDELVYANSVLDFLQHMPQEHPYWELYRQRNIVCCVGQGKWEDDLLASTRHLDTLLAQNNVAHWCDYWGFDVDHDWAWWRRQVVYFMEQILNDSEYPWKKGQ